MWDSSIRNICSGSTRISTRNISSCCITRNSSENSSWNISSYCCRNSTSASRNCCTSGNNSDSMKSKNSGASRNISGRSSASRNISGSSSRFNKSADMNSWSAMTMMSSSIGWIRYTGIGRTSIWEGRPRGFFVDSCSNHGKLRTYMFSKLHFYVCPFAQSIQAASQIASEKNVLLLPLISYANSLPTISSRGTKRCSVS